MHYMRERRNGDPSLVYASAAHRLASGNDHKPPVFDPHAKAFFRDVVVRHEGSDCLIWPYARDQKGYGIMGRDGRVIRVHRAACIEKNGPPPPHHEARHLCGKGHLGCCNPQHLAWGTHRQNALDRHAHGTMPTKLTPDQVREIRNMAGAMSQAKIGAMFGVSQGTVAGIMQRRTWAWLD